MSSGNNAVDSVLKNYSERLNSVAPSAVLVSIATMGIIGVALLITFSTLRPKNSVIYQPRSKYSEDEKKPPMIAKGFFSWVHPLLDTKEDLLMNSIGLDAVCFLRFLRMCRNIFLFGSIISCSVLIPINIHVNKINNITGTSWLSIMTIEHVTGSWLWAHVAVTYIVTLIIFFLIWTNYASMVELRWRWFRSDEYQNSLHSRSILITNVAKLSQSDPGITSLLTSLQIPYPTTSVHIGRRVGALPDLIEKHNDTVRALEGVLGKYFRKTQGGEKGENGEGSIKRPTMREGGQKVDAIDFLTSKIQRLEEKIEVTREQIGDKKAENYGFASFESVPFAHIVAKKLTGKTKKGSKFDLAPNPHDIIWENLTTPSGTRTGRKILGGIVLTVFFFLYLIPLIGVSVLANLSALSAYVKFIRLWIINYPFLFSAFIGIVPPLCSVILQLILPMIMRWIIEYEGVITHSQSDRVVTARYSAFLFITQLFIFSLLGLIVQIISQVVIAVDKKSASLIWDYLKKVPGIFQSTWVIQSTYWLTVLPIRGSSAVLDMAQITSLLLVWVRTKLFGRTPREIREWTKPPEFDFAVYIANHLLMVAVGFVYAPLAPLVPLFAAVAFAISTWVYKYQLMYVCVGRVETGGRLWRVIVNRMLIAAVMMQLMMVLTIGLKTQWLYAIALAPAVISVVIFKIILGRRYDQRFKWFIPTTEEMADLRLHTADARKNRLEKRFGHPSLHEPLFTPMLHKKVHHLLPTIYNGRIGSTQGTVDGKAVDTQTAGGLTFNLLESHDLAFDRGAYLQDRVRDEDEQTISTAFGGKSAIGTPGGDEDYFKARRQDYMDRGAFAQTPDDLPFELKRMPTQGTIPTAMSSTDNLIQYPPSYANQHSNSYSTAPPSRRPSDFGQSHRPSDYSQTSTQFDNEKYYQSDSMGQNQNLNLGQGQGQFDSMGRSSVDSRSATPPSFHQQQQQQQQYQQRSYSPHQYQSPNQNQNNQSASPPSRFSPSASLRGQTPPSMLPQSQQQQQQQQPQPQQQNRQSFDFGFDTSVLSSPSNNYGRTSSPHLPPGAGGGNQRRFRDDDQENLNFGTPPATDSNNSRADYLAQNGGSNSNDRRNNGGGR